MIEASLQEQLRLKYNPDNSPLRTLQLQMLDILIEFDRICKKHNISISDAEERNPFLLHAKWCLFLIFI